MKYLASVAVIIALGASTAACGSDSSTTSAPKPSTSAPSSAPTISDDDVTAKIVAGVPPKDVVWSRPEVPSDWKELKTDQGSAQWQVGTSACVVGVSQPAGVGSGDSPTDAEIVDRQVQQIASAIGGSGNLDFSEDTVMVPARVAGSTAEVKQTFVQRTFTAGKDAQGVVRAHRYGDFALIAYGACGKGAFEQQYSGGIEAFLDSLVATLTY